ncbi:ABC transporter ATP-binding protein [Candidatus Nephthysia bennettiae]|uniref:ABC transporter ATP-binding protein n=1 Tax=Candidatus Nephthysia bennettiae TaxID=3127016 RepID=A0A934KCM9_9BACT|nr:ABC transporter ATP-binding protein [Candidatus Dormibacteraeota bacterium]MBJ7612973.1 ABC transporter ATP-binding protein [Candidatus Dormibacteraeota bacterium]
MTGPNASPLNEAGATATLEVRELRTYLYFEDRVVPAVDGISFSVNRGETLAIVGESGSGKTMTGLSILRLFPTPAARIVSGQVLFGGHDLTGIRESEMREIRGNRISVMFQDPMTTFNPSLRVGFQVVEALLMHNRIPRREANDRALEMLGRMGIPHPRVVFDSYPHQLSGGMRQRAVLAMALLCRPEVLIADEPTTALDVTTQEQIIDLLQEMQAEFNLSIILITHDLGVVARVANSILVMYAGRPAEFGEADDIFYRCSHPYTRGLLDSVDYGAYRPGEHLHPIAGVPPRLDQLPPGCAFHPRCLYAEPICRDSVPEFGRVPSGHTVAACHPALAGRLNLHRAGAHASGAREL